MGAACRTIELNTDSCGDLRPNNRWRGPWWALLGGRSTSPLEVICQVASLTAPIRTNALLRNETP
jgi:hypothetical protein